MGLLLAFGGCGSGSQPLQANVSATDRWIALNEDCTNFFLWHYRAKPTRHLTKASIREYAGRYLKGPVTHCFVNPTSGLVAPFDSKYMDCMWRLHDARKCKCEGFLRFWVDEVRRLASEGIDPYAELMAAARERKSHVWVSMRMNDNHFVKEPDSCQVSEFQRTRRDMTREPGRKLDRGVGAWHYALDYAQKEVRDENMKVVRELAERYDAEGLELDFTRHQFYFRKERERADAHFLTEFVRQARDLAIATAKSRGCGRYGLAVRVPTTLQLCRAHGFDVDVWIREGLVDVVIPTNELNMNDYDLPVEEWLALAKEAPKPVRIVPGCDARVMLESRNESSRRLTTAAEYGGWIDNVYSRGATGLYFFNHFVIERLSATCRSDMGLSEDPHGLDPERVRSRNRAYPVSHRDYWQLDGAGFDMSSRQLPLHLDELRSVRVFVGTTENAGTCEVRLGFDREPSDALLKTILLNGVRPTCVKVTKPTPDWPGGSAKTVAVATCEFPVSAIDSGENGIRIGVKGDATLLLAGEIFLNTRGVQE